MPLAALRSPPLIVARDKQGWGPHPESLSPNCSGMSDGAKRSQRATPVRMPPRPQGDSKGRHPIGASPSAVPSRQHPLFMRDSAELRRHGQPSGKDSRRAREDAEGLMLMGKQLSPHHPLLGGAVQKAGGEDHEETGRDAFMSAESFNEDDSDEDPGMTDSATPQSCAGSDDGASSKLGAEEAKILNQSWQGSPHSLISSKSIGIARDAMSPQFALADASRDAGHERQCIWSPKQRHVAGSSVDQLDSRTYDDEDEDDSTVNQSLNISLSSSRREKTCNEACGEKACNVQSPASHQLSAWLSDDVKNTGSSRHRGMIAERATMGRKRVYGAVVIQQWFRKLLQQVAQKERDHVKALLRERREKNKNQTHVRQVQDEILASSLRTEKEQLLKANLQQREEEVARATQRLKRTLQPSLCLPPASLAAAAPRRATELISKCCAESSSPQSSSPQRPSSMTQLAALQPTPESVSIAAQEGEVANGQERSLMDALRVSVERSADMLGLARGNTSSPSANNSSPSVRVNASSPSCRATLTVEVGIEDEGASDDYSALISDPQDGHSHWPPTSPHLRAPGKDAGFEMAGMPAVTSTFVTAAASASRPSYDVGSTSPSYHDASASVACSAVTSELMQRRAMKELDAVMVSSPHMSTVRSPQKTDDERTRRYGNMDAAAKELQTSILSFLDAVESGVNASFASSVGGGSSGGYGIASSVGVGAHAIPPSPSASGLKVLIHEANNAAVLSPHADAGCGERLPQGPRRALALSEGDEPENIKASFGVSSRPPLGTALLHSPSTRFRDKSARESNSGVAASGSTSGEACSRGWSSAASTSAAPSLLSSPAVLLPAKSTSSNGTPILAAQVYGEVKARMSALKVELDQRDKTVGDLKEALRRQKEEAAAEREEQAEMLASKLSLQRQEYEAQVKRQLEFVDQLVNDKGALSAKCEDLAGEFQLLQRRFQDQIKQLEERQAKELKKQRESMAVSEKIRRDTWMQEKSREIKEMTVKGLQPEIERLLSKHKKELQRMEEVNMHELKRQREALAEAHERSMTELRERMLLERDRVVEREREAASLRMREQSDRFDQQLQAHRIRMAEDMAQERERLEAAHRNERQRVEDLYGMQVKDDSRRLAEAQREWTDREEELRRRHAAELTRVREQAVIEREQWQRAMQEKLEQRAETQTERAEAIDAMQKKLEKQRDGEIEIVIIRLEEEAEATKAKLKKEADDRAHRAIEQAFEKVSEAKHAEKEIMDKYLALFKQHTTADERLRACNERILELQEDNARLQQTLQRTEHANQKEAVAWEARLESVRAEYDRRVQDLKEGKELLQEQVRRCNMACKEQLVKHEHEARELNKRKMEELDGINARVRATVAKKDEIILSLQQQVRETEGRVEQYEDLLDRQRKELLS